MADEETEGAEGTAVRVALWRAMHVQVDPPPHVLEDEVGLRLAAPADGWRGTTGHGPRRHPVVPRRHCRPCPVRRGPGRRTSRSRRSPVRHSGCRSRHVRPAQACARNASPGLRSRSARPAGLETSTAGRARARCAGVAAAGAGRLRGRWIVVGRAARRRLRSGAAGSGRLDRRLPVSVQGGQRGHPAPNGRAGPRLDARHDVPPAVGAGRGCPPARVRGGRKGCTHRGDTLHQLLQAGRNESPGPPGGIPRGTSRVRGGAERAVLRRSDRRAADGAAARNCW